MFDFTSADLEAQLVRVELCDNAEISGEQFRALMELAVQAKGFSIANISRLRLVSYSDQVRLAGAELRALLMLAMRAKKSGAVNRPNLRVVS